MPYRKKYRYICRIKTKILFVCLGNICRSPLAEGIFTDLMVKNRCENKFFVDSAGTSDYHIGELPDVRTRKNAGMHGLTLHHRARQFSKEDFLNFDYIVAMDDSNLKNIQKLNVEIPEQAILLKMRQFDDKASNSDVPDPWFGGEKGFEEVYQLLEECCRNLFTFLLEKKS